jgi:hypothetical protein
MPETDAFAQRYDDLLEGCYDCVDRIVLNGYFRFIQSDGGFRTWWRQMFGDDRNLDNAHVMRFAGRFARRVRHAAKDKGIPVLDKAPKERMHELAEQHLPVDPESKGVFCITVHRAPNTVWGVIEYPSGRKHLERKSPPPWVNHYAFHIQDPDWGHITMKICPHPPFNVQVILNGHEYVARLAARKNVPFTQEGNCFTGSSNLAGLEKAAETIRSRRAKGLLERVCERWLYSTCLCYLLPLGDQERTRMHYEWSVYQLEYSRNFIFQLGRNMEEVFQTVIDRTRRALDVRTIRTLFGRKHRPFWYRNGKRPRLEVEVERPTYDLTVFKVHMSLLTLKIYTKGERVLRVEAIVHNAKREFKRYAVGSFHEITKSLRHMVQRFLEVIESVESSWVTDETLESLVEPSRLGASRVAGLDLNRSRIRAVMMAVLALSWHSRGFRVEEVAERVRAVLGSAYSSRQASYDLKKLRAKGLAEKLKGTRRYLCGGDALRTIMATVLLREKVIKPILSGTVTRRTGRPPHNRHPLDRHCQAIRDTMERLFQELGLTA